MPQLNIWHAGAIVVGLTLLLSLYITPEPEYKLVASCNCQPFSQIALCVINSSHKDCTCVPSGTNESEGERLCLEDRGISKLEG